MVIHYGIASGTLVLDPAGQGVVSQYVDPGPDDLRHLREHYQLDDHSLSSALDPDEVPRLEIDEGRLLLIWKRPQSKAPGASLFLDVSSLGLLLTETELVIVSRDDVDLAGGGGRLAAKIRTPLDAMLGLLLRTIQHYQEHLKVIKVIAREVQQKISLSMENEYLLQMFDLSESLVYYTSAINGNGVVLSRLRHHLEREHAPAEVVEYVEDLIIENNQCYKQAEIYSTIFSGLMDARGTLVNNNMNLLLKKLTVINVIFLPLNLIAGIGGMSEYSVMTKGISWPIAYGAFTVAMVGVGWLTAAALRRVELGGGAEMGTVKKRKGRRR
jgi:magnesium transporter